MNVWERIGRLFVLAITLAFACLIMWPIAFMGDHPEGVIPGAVLLGAIMRPLLDSIYPPMRDKP